MTKEFKNLLELFKADKDSFGLGLNIAMNYEKEFETYFGFTREYVNQQFILRTTHKQEEFQQEMFENLRYWLNLTIDEYCLDVNLISPRLPKDKENQCSGYIRLKELILKRENTSLKELSFLHPILRKSVFDNWKWIKNLKDE